MDNIELEKTNNEIIYLEDCLAQSKYMNEDDIRELALKEKPQMIIAGASAYSRIIDFKKMDMKCLFCLIVIEIK